MDKLTILAPLPYFPAGFAPMVLVKALGYDRAEDVDVHYEMVGVPGNGWRGVAEGRGDVTFVHTQFVFPLRQQGLPLKLFCSYVRHQNRGFVVPETSTIRSVEELRGGEIGVFSRDHFDFAHATLNAVGINPERDVALVPFRSVESFELDRMFAALRSNEIRAIWLLDVMVGEFAAADIPLRRLPTPSIDRLTPCACLYTTEHTLGTRSEVLGAYGRALSRATLFAMTNPNAAMELVWSTVPETRPAPGMEAHARRRDTVALETRLALQRIDNTDDPRWGAINAVDIVTWQDFMLTSRAITERRDVSQYYDNHLIEAFNAFDQDEVIAHAKSYKGG